ncbi:FtsX-like permease family protein [bacterium]|nr:FtsX-like permease family protein [bacterium]
MSLLARSQWRYLWSHPWLVLLSLLGVAVGVAGIVAMDLAIRSCERGFTLSQDSLTGKATHWLVAGESGLPEQFYVKLRVERGLSQSAPVVEGFISLKGGQSFRVLGVDPLAEKPFRGDWFADGQASYSATSALNQAGTVALTAAEARRLGVSLEGVLQVQGGDRLHVGALLTGLKPNQEQALQGQFLCDIAVAQELLGMQGRLSRVELILTSPQADQLQASLPRGYQLIAASTRSRSREQMSRAFFLNLRALSMLSLLVGGLLIYNVIHFLVLQRRTWMGQLRILGVTRAEIRSQVLAEAGWLGATGSLLGMLLGISLARLLLPLLTRTINDLYYNLQVGQTYLSPLSLVLGCLLGWGCSLLAAWWPAHEAATTPPAQVLRRSFLEQGSLDWLKRLSGAAALGLLISWATLQLAENSLGLNLLAMVGLMLSSAALTPVLVVAAQRFWLRSLPVGRWMLLKMALGGVQRSLSRLGVALVAMTVALSAVISITVMVHSFRLSLIDWLGRTLSSDLYIGLANRQAAKGGQGLPAGLLERISALPEVQATLRAKMTPVYYYSADQGPYLTQLVAQDPDLARLRFVIGPTPSRLGPGQALASEPFLRQKRLSPGSRLKLQTPTGPYEVELVAGFQDYASDSGYLMMDLDTYRQAFQDTGVTGLGVSLRGDTAEQVRAEILSWPESAGLEVRSQKALRQLSVEIFEQTFQVTRLLQVLAVLVAGLGTLGAVAANQLERRREYALWNCLGLTSAERWRLRWMESALCGLWSGLAAWPCGLLQAYAMVTFINRRAFGWSLEFHLDPWTLLSTPVLGLLASTLAVLLAGQGGRRPAEDLRQE